MSVMGPGRERGARVAFAAASGLSRLTRDIGLAHRAVVAHRHQHEQLVVEIAVRRSPSGAPWRAWRGRRARRGRPRCRLRSRRCGPRGPARGRCRGSSGRRPAAAGHDWPASCKHLVAFRRGAQHRIAGAAADVGRERDAHAAPRAAAPCRTGRSRETGSRSGRTRRPTGSPPAPRLRCRRDGCNGRTSSAARGARSALVDVEIGLRPRKELRRPGRSRPCSRRDASAHRRRGNSSASAPAASSCASVEVMAKRGVIA